jgi:hypothetical protein
MTSTRPNTDVRSKTIRGPVAAQACAATAAASSAARARRFGVVKCSFLILNCSRVTATAPRVSIGCLALLLGVLFSTTADAASKRVGVPKFDGVQEALVRKKVMQVLKAHGYDLAKSREMEIGLANTGALLDNDEGFAKVARELALSAIVTGEIGKKRAKITVHDGKDGSLLGSATFAGANPRKIMGEVGRDFWRKLGADVERGKTPSGAKKPTKVVAEAPEDDERTPDAAEGEGESAPEPEPRKKEKAEPAVTAEGGGEGEEAPKKKKKKKKPGHVERDAPEEEEAEVVPPTFFAQAGFSMINRNLVYNQDNSMPMGLRPYSLPAGPAVVANLVWYPLGPFTDGALRGLGVEGNIEQAFFVSSSLPTGEKFGTTIHEFSGGVRFRVPFGAGSFFFASLTGGEHAFVFKSTATGNRMILDIPDTIYRFMRPGIGLHYQLFADISLGVSGGFRWVLNGGGQFKDQFFTQATVNGADAQAYVGYRFSELFEARLTGTFRRYFSSMNCYGGQDAGNMAINNCAPEFTAGGAVDQYISGGVSIVMLMGGTETRPESEEPPPPPKRKRKVQSEDEEPPLGEEKGAGGGDE